MVTAQILTSESNSKNIHISRVGIRDGKRSERVERFVSLSLSLGRLLVRPGASANTLEYFTDARLSRLAPGQERPGSKLRYISLTSRYVVHHASLERGCRQDREILHPFYKKKINFLTLIFFKIYIY